MKKDLHNMLIKKPGLNRRERRILAIKNLVSHFQIHNQEELSRLLSKRGFPTTQSTLSRDMKKLGLIKREGCYQLPLITTNGALVPPVLSAHPAGNVLVVLKTLPTMAPSLGSMIDELKPLGVLGTVAGDDTVFVAVKNESSTKAVSKRLISMFSPTAQRI